MDGLGKIGNVPAQTPPATGRNTPAVAGNVAKDDDCVDASRARGLDTPAATPVPTRPRVWINPKLLNGTYRLPTPEPPEGLW